MSTQVGADAPPGPVAPTAEPDTRAEDRGTTARWLPLSSDTAWLAVMLLPGALTAFLAFRSGGFYPGATSLAAAEMAMLVGLRFALSRRPLRGVSRAGAVALGAMGVFCAWTLLSSNWSGLESQAGQAYSLALLYGLTLFFFATVPFDVRRIRWMVYGVAAAAVVVCGAALTALLLPDVIFDPALVDEPRLGYPLTYWNGLGILSCTGVILCAHLACGDREPPLARVLGAAAVPLLATTLFYTLSRGGIWAAAGALVIYLALGRPRGALAGVAAIVPATAAALLTATPTGTVADGYPASALASGENVAVVVAVCMLGAALVRALLLPLDGALAKLRLPERARWPAIAAAGAVAVTVALAGVVATDAPDVVSTKVGEFTDRDQSSPERGESRLLSARPEERFEMWEVGLDAFREEPLRGTGAGTFEERWNRDRPVASHVVNAHSLYVEVLGELGIVGLAALLIVLGLILGAFAFRARGPDRALFAALLAAGLAWAIHAGVDWDWQMPAVTLWLFALGGAALARSLRRRRHRYHSDLQSLAIRGGGVLICVVVAILPARAALSQDHLNSAIDSMQAGECRAAVAEARDSLSRLDERPTPYAVISYCAAAEGRPRAALAASRRALRRDPGDWELRYGLAVSLARAGLDPRPAARATARANPLDQVAANTPDHFSDRTPRAWRAAAANAVVLAPEVGDP